MSAPKISYARQAGMLEQTVKNLLQDIDNFHNAPIGPSRQVARELLDLTIQRAREVLQEIAKAEGRT